MAVSLPPSRMIGSSFSRSSPNRSLCEQSLARSHPVDVAAQRVDLAVVRDEPVGVRQRPRRERVRAEALMHQRQRGDQRRIRQIREHRPQLTRREHALVGQRVRRQADDVEEAARERIDLERVDRVLDSLANDVQLALEDARDRAVRRHCRANEHMLEDGLRRAGARADHGVVGRHIAPADQALPFLVDDRRDQILDRDRGRDSSCGRNTRPAPYSPAGGQRRTGRTCAQKCVGHLNQNAGAVTGVRLAAARAAVFQVDEDLQRLLDDVVRAMSLDVHDKSDAAGIVFGSGVVQTLSERWTGHSRI